MFEATPAGSGRQPGGDFCAVAVNEWNVNCNANAVTVGRQCLGTKDGAWRRGHSTNLVGVPTDLLASAAFNDAALPLHIAGARETNPHLFQLLEQAADRTAAAAIFEHYMQIMFGLDPPRQAEPDSVHRRRYRSSYSRLLRGWAYDSNSPEGAVLKGWVESRFGLFPTFHKGRIDTFGDAAWVGYVEAKMGSRFHNNAIYSQIDLLYEFCQWTLGRISPDCRHWLLFRGVVDFSEHQVVERLDRRRMVVRLNNLISFTAHRDMATWFGDTILEAAVPLSKVLFFNELLPRHALKGEGEVLAIGGDYRVRARYD